MTIRRTRIHAAAIVLGVALSATLGLTSCSKSERWCELDRGDVLVENYHCEQNQAGYEWEPDHDKPKVKKKPNKAKKH
ncbi:hypothetical protein [Nocardia aurea]|uniref:Lipoprotein n=1 Tax=Nocardia aurea TaxID=2144174 RepID=A0ABV3FVX0_9NOCA